MYSVKSHVKDREPTQELFSQEDSWVGCIFKEPALNEATLSDLKALLDVLVSDSLKGKEKEEWKRQEKEDKDEKTKGEDEGRGPPGGPVNGKEKTVVFL